MADEPPDEHTEPELVIDIGEPTPESMEDFKFYLAQQDEERGKFAQAFRGLASWRITTLGRRPHIAATFKLHGKTYQMRLYPQRDACGPADIVIARELRKKALYDAATYGSFDPEDLEKEKHVIK